MAADIEVTSGERRFIDYTMTYASNWSVTADQSQTVESSDVDTAYFYLRRNKDDTDAVLSFSTATAAEMAWVTSTKLRVKLGASQETLNGVYFYELRLKFPTGEFVTVEVGTIEFLPSPVGTP